LNSLAGLVRLDSLGDTVFVKTYTDTNIYFDNGYSCDRMPDGGFILGGMQEVNYATAWPALLVRTDSMGNMLWSRTYWKDTSQQTTVNTVEALDNGQILVGAMSSYLVVISVSESYSDYQNSPWFMLLDSAGNIIKDVLYDSIYGGGGNT
jgi:hypothetical protein